MAIFTDVKKCLVSMGLRQANVANSQQLQLILVITSICVLFSALLSTSWYLLFEAQNFQQYAESLPLVNGYIYATAEFCLFVIERNTMIKLMDNLQSMIRKRMCCLQDS